jgi:hypothetical protein
VPGKKLSESAPRRKRPATPVGLSPAIGRWWRLVWASPMAAVWLAADVPALERLARLLDKRERGSGPAAELAEIRQLEDRFGLSPLARRRLQWEVDRARDVELAARAAAAEAAPDAAPGADDGDGRYLRAVESS